MNFKRCTWPRTLARRIACGLPLVLIAGCTPTGTGPLGEFAADLARSALAAWLL